MSNTFLALFDEKTALKFQEIMPDISFVQIAVADIADDPNVKNILAIVPQNEIKVEGDETCTKV